MSSPLNNIGVAYTPYKLDAFYNNGRNVGVNLLDVQMANSVIGPNGMVNYTGVIVPDRAVIDRLGHLDPELYDLRDTSSLMKLLKVLLGGAGAGGLRKQMSVARLQNSFNGMHFLDLDRFYGALFGIQRTKTELIPDFGTLNDLAAKFDPFTDAAGSEIWDEIHSRDASYRDKLIKFTACIPNGASYAGIKSMCEALTTVECDIYESFEWIADKNASNGQAAILVHTYQSLGNSSGGWGTLESKTWNDWGGGAAIFAGRTGEDNYSEIVIQPKRILREDEKFLLMRVLDRFLPAGAQATLSEKGMEIHSPAVIRAVGADSEHWEIIKKLTPSKKLVNVGYNNYNPELAQPRPAFSQYQGESWSYNADIIAVDAYAFQGTAKVGRNWETVAFSGGGGRSYTPDMGVMTAQQAMSAHIVSDGVMTASPYRATHNTQQFAGYGNGRGER